MGTTKYSFTEIFEKDIVVNNEPVKLQQIIIPIIQRDYAQGRQSADIERVRNRFLDALYSAITVAPITLDFVYGDIDENGIMTPLDGQQRLTTLFLLHWYAAKKTGIKDSECHFLSKFGYETRYSARYFCKELLSFTPSFKELLSEEIINQAWFPLGWKKDPTISSMLVMLNAINDKFKDVDALWNKLKSGAITFYFLPIKDMGLTDELYIKMNSRGKPLTQFEHFKAELERYLCAIDENISKRIMRKIDRDWTDMLWQYRDSGEDSPEDAIIDDEFLRYFRFICDVICYQGGESPQGKSSNDFDRLEMYFAGGKDQVLQNIETMESFFDCWCNIAVYNNPTKFLNSCLTQNHDGKRIVLFYSDKTNIFEDCLHSYTDKNGERVFPLKKFVLLYAIVSYLCHSQIVSESDYLIRLRCINNLIQNSDDEVRDRTDRNRIPAILKQVDSIMVSGNIDSTIQNSFNANQIEEENQKKQLLKDFPEKAQLVYELEDNKYLNGQISIVGVDNVDYAKRFVSLFSCDLDKIDCALMTIGNYSQQERNNWRHQFASSVSKFAWDELFHKSSNVGFENTSKILIELLSKEENFTNASLSEIVQEYISSCEENNYYPWEFYYIKYDSFRPGSFGKYSNEDVLNQPYMYLVLQTKAKWSSNTYLPFLKETDESHLSRDSYGQRLVYGDRYICCENDQFIVKNNDNDEIIKELKINQNEEGVDLQDRVLLLKRFIAKNFTANHNRVSQLCSKFIEQKVKTDKIIECVQDDFIDEGNNRVCIYRYTTDSIRNFAQNSSFVSQWETDEFCYFEFYICESDVTAQFVLDCENSPDDMFEIFKHINDNEVFSFYEDKLSDKSECPLGVLPTSTIYLDSDKTDDEINASFENLYEQLMDFEHRLISYLSESE